MNRKLFVGVIVLALAAGCACKNDDPNQGGLFGYWGCGEQAYQRRAEERKQVLQQEQQQTQAVQEEKLSLEQEKTVKSVELDDQQRQLNTLDADIDQISTKVGKVKADASAKQREKQKIEKQAKDLKAKVQALKKDAQLSADEKNRKISLLKDEIDALMKTANAW